MNAEYSGGL